MPLTTSNNSTTPPRYIRSSAIMVTPNSMTANDPLVDIDDIVNQVGGDLNIVHEVSTKRSHAEINDEPKEYMYRTVPILPHIRRYQEAYAKRLEKK